MPETTFRFFGGETFDGEVDADGLLSSIWLVACNVKPVREGDGIKLRQMETLWRLKINGFWL